MTWPSASLQARLWERMAFQAGDHLPMCRPCSSAVSCGLFRMVDFAKECPAFGPATHTDVHTYSCINDRLPPARESRPKNQVVTRTRCGGESGQPVARRDFACRSVRTFSRRNAASICSASRNRFLGFRSIARCMKSIRSVCTRPRRRS
jgi:hypothetical protein